jgi:hypothetical protein
MASFLHSEYTENNDMTLFQHSQLGQEREVLADKGGGIMHAQIFIQHCSYQNIVTA